MKRGHLSAALAFAAAACLCAPAAQQAAQNAPPQGQAQPPKADDGKKAPRKRVVSDLSGFDLLGSGKQTMVVGATRSVTRPFALAPHLARVYDLAPVFTWSYAADAEKFLFVLEDEGQKEVFEKEVQGSSFRYPANAPALEPGKTYFWTVAVQMGVLGTVQSARVGFLVLATAERTDVQKAVTQASSADPFQRGLERARVLTSRRLWYDAIAAYTELIARYSDRAVLYEERGTIYAQIEATHALSDQDFARADALAGSKP